MDHIRRHTTNILNRIAIFFGIKGDDQENLQIWKERAEKKIEGGEYGVPLAHTISQPSRSDMAKAQAIAELSSTLAEISNTAIDLSREEIETLSETNDGQTEHMFSEDFKIDHTEIQIVINKMDKNQSAYTLDKTQSSSVDKIEQDEPLDDIDLEQEEEEQEEEENATNDFEGSLKGNSAYEHYKLFLEIEKNNRIKRLEESKRIMKERYIWRQQKIDEVVDLAKAYFRDPMGEAAEEWKRLRREISGHHSVHRVNTDIRFQLGELPVYKPYFTWSIIAIQLISFIVICGMGGISNLGLEPKMEIKEQIRTLLGTETVHRWTTPNIWMGPTHRFLAGIGAVFAPCMREDYNLIVDSVERNYSVTAELGCCEKNLSNTAATTTKEECKALSAGSGRWRNIKCGSRAPGDNSIAHILHPCCVDLKGSCDLLTHAHCKFIGGTYHSDSKESCSQVNCINDICKMGGLAAMPDKPWLPETPGQMWRLPLSLIYHHGILHLLLVVIAEWILFRQIERLAGSFRIIIIYLISGLAGLMAAATFTPYLTHAGAEGAVFGIVAVILVELIQFWKLVEKPKKELAKIGIGMLLFFMSGTLPYLNNFTILFGFLAGLISACAFMPYVTFGRWHKKTRIIIVAASLPALILMFFLLFFLFLKVQSVDKCCKAFNCLHYTPTMCDMDIWTESVM